MGMFDPSTGEYNDTAYALDQHAAIAGQKSVFESAFDVVTKGIPLTGLAVVNSFANTAVELNNFFGGDAQKLTIENEVGSGDLNDYYTAHQQGIEAAALLGGSLIPGLAAIKATKLAMYGSRSAAIARATGIPAGMSQAAVQGALQEINAGDAALYGSLNASKFKIIAGGFGDQALQAVVYEAATAATMKASPLLDKDGFSDVVENMFFGALVGGGVGGVLENVGIYAILNKAKVAADVATKAQETAKYLGKGNYIVGDKVAELVNSIDDIPFSDSILGSKKAAATRDAAILNAKGMLKALVPDGDPAVSNAVFDVLLKQRETLGMGKEEIYDYFARLAQIDRNIPETQTAPSGGVFYINRFGRGKVDDLTFNDVATNTPHPDADLSLSYQLRPFATSVKIGKATDFTETTAGTRVPLYDSAKSAFEAGNDLYIDKNLRVFVNPDAPNIAGRVARPGESRALSAKEEASYRKTGQLPAGSKPLLGGPVTAATDLADRNAPLVLDVINGGVKESAFPVVGDYGVPKLFDKGLLFGEESSLQNLGSGLTAATPTLDANARYVWAAQRGIKAGDAIAAGDIPLLEQLYREASQSKDWTKYISRMSKSGVTIGDEPLSEATSANDLLGKIRDAKDNLISDVIRDNPKLSSEEVALRANVPEKYLENGLKAQSTSEYMIDPAQHSQVNHVKLSYDIGNIQQQDGQILRGMVDVQYRISLIQDANRAAAAKEFGPDYEKFLINKTASDANLTGVGPTFLKASNAAYGSLGQETERVGRTVADLNVKRRAVALDRITAASNYLRDNPTAFAEVSNFDTVLRSTGAKYVFLPEELADKYGVSKNTAVLKSSLVRDPKTGEILDWNKDLVPDGFVDGKHAELGGYKGKFTYYQLSDGAADFKRANTAVNNDRILSQNNLNAAQGINRRFELDELYAPPIDTQKYPHFALVRAKEGTAFSDSGTSIITAETAEKLEQKIAALRSDFDVYTKDLLKKHHEVLGDYEYDRNFSQGQVNSVLLRRGILNDMFPDGNVESYLKGYIDWHSRKELQRIRDHVEIANAQLFATLDAMGQRFIAPETSQVGFVAKYFGKTAPNPYGAYTKSALAISEKEQYRLWAQTNEVAESFASTAFRTAKAAFVDAQAGRISFEQATKMSESLGLGNPYAATVDGLKTYQDIANQLPPERYLSKFVATANSILAATAIRLDVFQSVINAISTPVLLLSEANSARNAELAKLLTTELPDGSGRSIPGISKLLYNSVTNFFDKNTREQWMPVYKDIQAVRDKLSDFFTMTDNMSLPYGRSFNESAAVKNLQNAVDTASKFTGSDFSEQFARFIAADTGRQIFQAAGYTGNQLTDNISTFVNRVHGNYVASQRPIAFQGPIGQAIGLFQTYQFNLMQQIFRYVENGEGKTLAILAGTQSTLFGLQGLPGFQAINNHIVGNAANNPAHKDLYSTIPSLVDKKLGDYLLYGVASNWLNTGLYGRGDINPRNITVLPINPIDYPAISGSIKFVGSLLDTAQKIAQGGSVPSSLLLGLEHNGLSRPLSGLAQMMQGFTTTGKGQLVSATRPELGDNTSALNDLYGIATFSRLLGARPLDEAITMDAMYRKTLYTAKDTVRITDIGEAAKTHLYNHGVMDPDLVNQFAASYASAGGHINQFGREMFKWTQESNASVANQIFRHLGNNPLNQQMMQIMGGIPLPDFTQQTPGVAAARP